MERQTITDERDNNLSQFSWKGGSAWLGRVIEPVQAEEQYGQLCVREVSLPARWRMDFCSELKAE